MMMRVTRDWHRLMLREAVKVAAKAAARMEVAVRVEAVAKAALRAAVAVLARARATVRVVTKLPRSRLEDTTQD